MWDQAGWRDKRGAPFAARWLNTRPTASSPLQRSQKAEAFPLTSFHFINSCSHPQIIHLKYKKSSQHAGSFLLVYFFT
ncbi:hypothetical protein [Planococcus maitriensis]|uniref:Uncharacterized protein n=1 Tax=Planococcus maitriensis TaxID=221799 RepID=A0A365K2U3_9BACL|nr:hypothetical protein [Planococcus maitriensis]RAZ66948.1 hypothetical protein DP119_11640 [Planococcus maitriensis]